MDYKDCKLLSDLRWKSLFGSVARTVSLDNLSSFYPVGGGWDANVIKTPNPYAETVFENSPLNRVLRQGSSGSVWHPTTSRTSSAGNTVELEYGTNVAQVLKL